MTDDHNARRPTRVERPRVEPEIIPPGAQRDDGVYRVRMSVPPFGVVLILALVALVSVAIIVLVIGALLVWIPIVALAVSVVLLFFYARHYWFRARSWWRRG
jgi:hypothetical protein